jgi:hypothetical protein
MTQCKLGPTGKKVSLKNAGARPRGGEECIEEVIESWNKIKGLVGINKTGSRLLRPCALLRFEVLWPWVIGAHQLPLKPCLPSCKTAVHNAKSMLTLPISYTIVLILTLALNTPLALALVLSSPRS